MRGASLAPTDRSCMAPLMPVATRAISFIARRANSSTSCVSRSANSVRMKPAHSQHASRCRSRRSPTARTFASWRPGAAEPGDIVDEAGRVLGPHGGVIHFTVGQRKGIGVAGEEPLYVLRLEPATRRVVVGPRASLGATRVPFDRVNWLAAPPDAAGVRVAVKLRSAQPPVPAMLRLDGDHGTAVLDEPVFGVAPGQACVAYDGDRVLGGGWIARA